MISSSARWMQRMGRTLPRNPSVGSSNTRGISLLSSVCVFSANLDSNFNANLNSNLSSIQSNQKSKIRIPRFTLQQQQQAMVLQKRCFSSSNETDGSSPLDYFTLFGLSRNFGIDQSEMKQTYLKLMNEYHPDKQLHQQQNDGNESEKDNDENEILLTAETITHAFQVLKSPHTRALHWLEIHGSPLVEESTNKSSSSSSDETNNDNASTFTNQQDLVGMEFLMEIMEWREAIEDAGSDQAKLKAIVRETKALHQTCEKAMEDLLDEVGVKIDTKIDPATLQDARQLTAQLQYWHRLERTLKESLEVG